MKKNLFLLVVFTAFVFSIQQAKASLLLEPFAGMVFNSSADDPTDGNKVSGTVVGARLGVQQMGLMAGLDGRRNSWNLDPDSGGADSDFTFTQLGFFVGYELPIKVRFWGTYIFSMDGTDDDDANNKIKEGSGTVFGFGLKILGWLSANLEASNMKTDKYKNNLGEVDYKVDYTAYTLSLSFPLNL